MNDFVSKSAQAVGLTCNGDEFYGTLNGYQVSGRCYRMSTQFGVSVYLTPDLQMSIQFIAVNLLKGFPGIRVLSENGNGIAFRAAVSPEASARIVLFLQQFTGMISSFTKGEACPLCGEPMDEGVCEVSSGVRRFKAHEACFERVGQEQTAKKTEEAPSVSSYVRGIAGALLGGLTGIAACALINMIGFASWIAMIFMPFFVMFLWEKLGGKNHVAKIVTMWIVSVVCFFAALVVGYTVIVAMALAQEGITDSAFEYFVFMIRTQEQFRNALLLDVSLSVAATLGSAAFMTVRAVTKERRTSSALKKIS